MPAIQLMLLTKNMLTLANSILDGSELFQDDMSMNNYRIKNVHTLVNDYDAVDRLLCEIRYRKMTNDHQLKVSNDGRWDAKDKTDQYRYLGNCPPIPSLTQQKSIDNKLRECLCESGPVDFAWDTDFARFLCVVRHSCTYTKTTISLIGSLYFSEFYGN